MQHLAQAVELSLSDQLSLFSCCTRCIEAVKVVSPYRRKLATVIKDIVQDANYKAARIHFLQAAIRCSKIAHRELTGSLLTS